MALERVSSKHDETLEQLRAALAERYDVLHEVGRGGMSTVYEARDLKHGRAVAIKVLLPVLADALGPERFLQEIQIAANLVHPHILPLHDSGDADGLLYYVMPFVPGESLRNRLDREQQLPVPEAIKITRQVLSALSHAHSHGIVHRDIKPENILLSGGEAVVADFGIARAIGAAGSGRLTQAGMSLGTPGYMSPEQATGETDLDARSDIYSVGCMLHEMLAGQPPFTGPVESVIEQHLSADPPAITKMRRTVTPEIESAIRMALHKTRADRFTTASAFSDALGAGEVPRIEPRPTRLGARSAAAAAAVVVVAAVLFGIKTFRPTAAAAVPQLDLAVFPFRPTGTGAGEYSEAVADLLATALDGTPELSVADPWALWRPLRPARDARAESPDPAEADRLAAAAGARRFVLGSLVGTGDALNLTVRLYDVGAPQPTQTLAAVGTADSLHALVQRAAVSLIASIWSETERPNMPPIESYATASAPALKSYLRAKEAMRRGHVHEAEAAIDTALALDTAFALAMVEAIGIKSWARYVQGEFYAFGPLADRAARYRDALGERNRLRLDAAIAAVRTNGLRAAEVTGRILERDSTDLGAWYNLTYYHLVYGWQYGRGPADAVAAAERLVRLDSTYIPGVVMRAHLALAFDDAEDVDLQLRRLRTLDTTNVLVRGGLVSLRSIRADDAEFDELAEQIAASPTRDWIAGIRALRSYRPARAETLMARLRERAGPGQPTWTVESAQARLWIAEGRLRQVDSAIQAGEYRTYDLYRVLERFLVAATMAGVGDSAIAARAVASLAAYVPADSALAYWERRPVWWTGWMVGAYNAMFGDTAVTRRWQEAIGTLPAGGTPQDYRGALQSDLEARLAVRRGDLDSAVALAQRAYDLWGIHTENDWGALAAPAMRFHLALLLRTTGQPRRAEALLRSLIPPGTWMSFLTARASFELGSLAEERGDFGAASAHYLRALRLWERGGAESEAWRARAAEGADRAARRIG